MSIINNGLLLASGADAATTYQISRSIRLNAPDSAYFSRTPGSAGNRRTFTVSCWVKRSALSSNQVLLSSNSNNSAAFELAFTSGDALAAYLGTGPNLVTSSVYRDCSAFYHIICAVDTTQSTASDRIKLYVNGTQITAFSASNYPSQNLQFDINNTTAHGIGRESGGTSYFNGYIADFYLLDGTATTPSTFAETDAVTGQWVPKTPTGISYGTNGFRLSFSDNSGTTSTTLGKDGAGSNNWTPNNFSVASGSGNDSLTDSPTSYGTDTGAGGEVRGNYAAFNALQTGLTLSNGNLDGVGTSGWRSAVSTIGTASGKFYYEATILTLSPINGIGFGIVEAANAQSQTTNFVGDLSSSWGCQLDGNVKKVNNATYTNITSGTYSTSDVLMVAVDVGAGKVWFGRNGSWFEGSPSAGTGASFTNVAGTIFPVVSCYGSGSSIAANFGQRAFAYTAPSGFKALCDTNLTSPTIIKPSTVMDVLLYTGNGSSSRSVSGLNFSPDLVWLKARSFAPSHHLFDTIRGATKFLGSDTTNAEQTGSDRLTAFDSAGFTLGSNAEVNQNGSTYVAWAWDAGSAANPTTNTQGSITSQVRTNGYLSIVTYTGNGTNGTSVGHGLNVVPGLTIIKRRDSTSTWRIKHGTFANNQNLEGFSTNAVSTENNGAGSAWYALNPTSTIINLGNNADTNASGGTYVAYCFAPVAGYSSFGSYTGNGSADGVFVHLGFRPKWLMVKRTDAAEYWIVFDAVRNTYNIVDLRLLPSASNAEGSLSTNPVDFLSNGFKNRGSDTFLNGSGATYIYAAFAESPFQYARAR